MLALPYRVKNILVPVVSTVNGPRKIFSEHRGPHTLPANSSMGDGDEGDRTPDPLLAKQVLSQLSYIPDGALLCFKDRSARTWIRTKDLSFIRAAL